MPRSNLKGDFIVTKIYTTLILLFVIRAVFMSSQGSNSGSSDSNTAILV